jgi:hypothetical protein
MKDWYYIRKKLQFLLNGMKVRDWMTWGTYGKTGDQPLKLVLLKNMSDDHIQAILDTQFHISNFYRRHIKKELRLRKIFPELARKETT